MCHSLLTEKGALACLQTIFYSGAGHPKIRLMLTIET